MEKQKRKSTKNLSLLKRIGIAASLVAAGTGIGSAVSAPIAYNKGSVQGQEQGKKIGYEEGRKQGVVLARDSLREFARDQAKFYNESGSQSIYRGAWILGYASDHLKYWTLKDESDRAYLDCPTACEVDRIAERR